MKGKRTKKITLSISALAVVTAIITVVALLVNTQNQKAKLLADPEIQKSMEYEQVQEGDEKVPENLQLRGESGIFEKANIMLLDGENVSRLHVDHYFKENNIEPEHILEVSGMDMLIEFARIGLGVACVIKQFVRDELNRGELVEIPLSVPINKREVGLAFIKSTKLTSSMEKFMDYIKVASKNHRLKP